MDTEKFKEGFFHIFKAAGYSLAGLATGLRLSLAFRQEAAILVLLLVLLGVYGKPVSTWLIGIQNRSSRTCVPVCVNLAPPAGMPATSSVPACSVVQPCLTLCDPVDCSPSGFSVHRIIQARKLDYPDHFLFQGIFLTQGWNLRLLH